MQSVNMFNEEQISNGAQRSPFEALDKAINTADTSSALLDTLNESEKAQEVHVSPSTDMSTSESQGSSTEKQTVSIQVHFPNVGESNAIRMICHKFLRVKRAWVVVLPLHRNGGVVRWVS